ncbi:MAG: mechanosensitive ion channel [Alphaproteobacteria bacterium]|nr:mechanosensitive ion channel [Alphaproteobacteria bacterium]MDP6587855.1 mechanosensitive ion channel [Alphaproteobacteria bacterium]
MIALAALLACCLLLAPLSSPAAAEAENAVALNNDELAEFVETLEDPAERERFLDDLKALLAARAALGENGESTSAGASALKNISDGLEHVGGELVRFARGLADIPEAARWLGDEWSAAESRDIWTEMVWKLAVVIGGGIIAAFIFSFGLRRPRRFLESVPRPNPWLRPLMLLGYNLLRVVPALAFAGAGYGLLTVLDPHEVVRLVALSAINAHVIAVLLKAAANQGLAPWTPNLRMATISDRTAVYCVIWWRRLINIGVYGYFICQAVLLLGLPEVGYLALVKVLGIIVVALLISLILQNRVTFATWIRSGGERKRWRAFFLVAYRVADFWHILAILYVLAGGMLAAALGLNGFLFFLKSSAASIAIIWAMGFALIGIQKAVDHGFRLRPDVSARYPGMQERVNRYLPVTRVIVQLLVIALAVILVAESWNIDVFTWLATETGRIVIGRIASIIAIALVALAIWEIASSMIDRYLSATDEEGEQKERGQRARTLLPLARNALRIVIGIVALLMILTEIGIDVTPILAGVGVIGLAIGFGAQTLVKDVITGIFILLENSLAVGDVVSVGGASGVVETISIRSIRLRDVRGNVHTIPFSAASTVTNMTKDYSYYLVEAGVAYRENYDEVAEIMREVGEDLRADADFGGDILEPISIMGLDRFEDSAVIVRARLKTEPAMQWSIGREYNRRLKAAFDARGIEMPFPHQTVYFGEDKEGHAPPAFITLEDSKDNAPRSKQPGKDRKPVPVARKSPAAAGEDDGGDGGDGF